MPVQLEHLRVADLPALALSNDALRIVVVPDVGGKVTSLISPRTGREWLWTNSQIPLRRPPQDATDFSRFDSGGWDEIFPTVNPCRLPDTPWGNRELTDHGELWSRLWQIAAAERTATTASLTLTLADPALPFRFTRTLALSSDSLTLVANYELTNTSDAPLPYLWAAHPLLAIQPGDELHLPQGTRVSSTGILGQEVDPAALPFAWPHLPLTSGDTLDLSTIPAPTANFAAKLFAENVSSGAVAITDPTTNESLTLTFDPAAIPHVALWLNYHAWSGASPSPYFNLGLEPTTTPADTLALAEQTAHQLAPHATTTWQLNLTLT
jgi:galactose mutarotase-like enzyme